MTALMTLTLLSRHHGRGIRKLRKNIRVLELLSRTDGKRNAVLKIYPAGVSEFSFFQVTISTIRQPGGPESMREA